ncbi:MAG: M1 family aminopeptidase, partial [Flavobacteriales bacterium]
ALEIPTNIAYPQSMITASLSANDKLLAHELGHQWWGNVIAPYNHNDMWLKEGPAEYSAHLMTEWMYGRPDFIHQVKINHLDVLKNAHVDDGGFQPMSPMPDEVIYGTHTYYKGASVMHNLRAYMGDALFRTAMSSLQANHTYTAMTPELFRDWLEEASGLSLDHFFDDQIFQPGFSVFVVDSFQVDNELPNQFLVTAHIQQKLRACSNFYANVPLDYTCIGEFGQTHDGQWVGSGQYSTLQFTCPFEPRMLILNRHNRLNQARMDFEVVLDSSESLNPILPYVDFRVYKEHVVDSTLLRIEHVWAAPDQVVLGEGVFEISSTHYYTVDGLWNDDDFFTAKVYYNGSATTDLDYDLYHAGEQQAVLLYRRNASEPWELCDDFSLGGGSLTNGDGSFVIDTLRRGQYAFANGDISAPVDELLATVDSRLQVFPNPASSYLTVSGSVIGREDAVFDIYASDGRLCARSIRQVIGSFQQSIDVQDLEAGPYVLRSYTMSGKPLGIRHLVVAK